MSPGENRNTVTRSPTPYSSHYNNWIMPDSLTYKQLTQLVSPLEIYQPELHAPFSLSVFFRPPYLSSFNQFLNHLTKFPAGDLVTSCWWPCHQQATSSVLYTTSCKHSLVLLRMRDIIARNMLSWLKLLIKLLLLHPVGCLYYYINGARPHKHQLPAMSNNKKEAALSVTQEGQYWHWTAFPDTLYFSISWKECKCLLS